MNNLDAFEKLDGTKEKVFFRAPTVGDYRNYSGLPRDREQAVTTRYLNDLQVVEKNPDGKLNDAAMWTIHDRVAALYYIYISTRKRPVVTQSYLCNHCKQQHGRQLDLTVLAQTFKENTEKAIPTIKLPHKELQATVQALTGQAAEHLELLRNYRDSLDEDSEEHAIAHVDMRVYEVAHCLRFADEDETLSFEEAAKVRFDYLLSLHPEDEYQLVALEVNKALLKTQHGLLSSFKDGELQLITPAHQCPEKEGNSTQLLLPFHNNPFIPTINPTRMG